MESMQFSDFLELFPNYDRPNLVSGHDPSLTLPSNNDLFFIEPTLRKVYQDSGDSPFVIITAPGATGKSALSNYLCTKRNAILWNLAKAKIGDHYFIGTLTSSFGTTGLSSIITKIQTGKTGFVIDAFDEAEIACGWERIQDFIKEISTGFVSGSKIPTIILIARYETAEYLYLLLEDNGITCPYFCIDFFDGKKSLEFLLGYIKKSKPEFNYESKAKEIFEKIAGSLEKQLQTNGSEDSSFCGYAPVIQAIATLIMEESNLQQLENRYSNDDNSEIINSIIMSILQREHEKFVSQFMNKIGKKAIKNELFTIDEQLFYLVCQTSGKTIELIDDIKSLGLSASDISEYLQSIKQFIPQHPFLLNSTHFASPVFRDYCNAILLSKGKYREVVLKSVLQKFASITALFWKFYLSVREKKQIEGYDIGIIYESILAQNANLTKAAIYDFYDKDGRKVTCLRYGKFDSLFEVNIESDLTFYHHLKNMTIKTAAGLIIDSTDFSIFNTEIDVSSLKINAKKIEIICNDVEKIVEVYASKMVFGDNLEINNKYGKEGLIVSSPDGKVYPWIEYFREKNVLEIKSLATAFMALRKILKWFRKDRYDYIACNAEFIRSVVTNNNPFNLEMLKYLLETHAIWEEQGLFKIAPKESERKGINFNSLKGLNLNEKLKKYLEEFLN
jgi:hypothetical protein